MVMGDGSCSRGHGFEYRRCLLDGHDIFHIDLLKKLYCLFEKRPGVADFFKKRRKKEREY